MQDNKTTSLLTLKIRDRIQQSLHKSISFHDYMEMCLYDPTYGYYSVPRQKIGKEGDFYTSSAIGGIMGAMVGSYVLKIREHLLGGFDFVEWGGGTGQLAQQILLRIQQQSQESYHSMRYIIIEQSDYHRKQQQQLLQDHLHVIQFMTPEQWKESGDPSQSIIFSNELLDAFPVHRIRKTGGEIQEIQVGWEEHQQQFVEMETLCHSTVIHNYLQKEGIVLREAQTAEINLEAIGWVNEMAAWLQKGYLISIDYGDVAEEIYAPHRMKGTLVCYRNHQLSDDPYLNPGEQDMTTHVNFSACIRTGEEAGFQTWKLQTQKEFLVDAGIFQLLQNHSSLDPFSPEAKQNRAIRQLLWSDQMSELFKVLIQTKNCVI